jgi:ABC-2 type transport system ATP-binding protein
VRGATKRFGTRLALDAVDLTVEPGEIHAVLGPNGAGKTTLLRVVSGMLIPDAGSVHVLGSDASRKSATRGAVGFVPSGDRSFYLRLSGLENLIFFGRLHGFSLRVARASAHEMLESVGLGEATRLAVGLYSHGMQRRLAMARALLADPSVLLVDEATHDLDPEGAQRIRQLVVDTAARHTAVVWTTQRLEEIRSFADTVTVLRQGQVRFSGSVSALTAQANLRVFVLTAAATTDAVRRGSEALVGLGSLSPREQEPGALVLSLRDGVVLGDALGRLVETGLCIESIREERSAVEEVFLQLTADEG